MELVFFLKKSCIEAAGYDFFTEGGKREMASIIHFHVYMYGAGD